LPDVLAAAFEILRLASSDDATQARLKALSEASAAARQSSEDADRRLVALTEALHEHERELAILTERQAAEQAERLKELAAAAGKTELDRQDRLRSFERRESTLAADQASLAKEWERVKAFERYIEVRASDLSARAAAADLSKPPVQRGLS
jgi:hypothetical protein